MPKAKKTGVAKPLRHNPLANQIVAEEQSIGLRANPRSKLRRKSQIEEEDGGESVLPAAVTKRVLQMTQEQKASGDLDGCGEMAFPDDLLRGPSAACSEAGDLDMSDVEIDADGFVVMEGATEEEQRALSLFLPGAGKGATPTPQGQTLGDMILQKIQDHEAKATKKDPNQTATEDQPTGLSPKVIQVYTDIGKWLKHYKSGKIPKAFKVIPSLVNWEEVLSLTGPLNWSPAATYQAVNIFASNLNPKMAQRFYNLVLLPAVRQNIQQHKRLNFHYYMSLRKAMFKPSAFFKGIVMPMASDNCTLREAVILCSVLGKCTLPAMHGCCAMARLCTMTPWYGTTSILLATLLNKKYSLPLQVLHHLVVHFCSFRTDERVLPLVWHRALLVFVQRYKHDLSDDHRKQLRELLKVHFHEGVGSEVRRELLAPKPGVVQDPGAAAERMDVS